MRASLRGWRRSTVRKCAGLYACSYSSVIRMWDCGGEQGRRARLGHPHRIGLWRGPAVVGGVVQGGLTLRGRMSREMHACVACSGEWRGQDECNGCGAHPGEDAPLIWWGGADTGPGAAKAAFERERGYVVAGRPERRQFSGASGGARPEGVYLRRRFSRSVGRAGAVRIIYKYNSPPWPCALK